jgi:hypothetical protein
MPFLRHVDDVLRGNPVDSEIVIRIGKTRAGLAGFGAFAVMTVGIPGRVGDPLQLAPERLVGRVLKLLEKPLPELAFIEGPDRACPSVLLEWTRRSSCVAAWLPSLERRVSMPVPACCWR